MTDLFDVYQFFPDDSYEHVGVRLTAEAAVNLAKQLTESLGARIGTTRRIIITDGEDFTVRLPDGATAIVCSRLPRRRWKNRRCDVCGANGTHQCDYPVAPGRTCDCWLCRRHAVRQGKNRDYCQRHAKALGAQSELVL